MASTTRYKRGDIVLVSFPFTDLSSSKRRPALVVSPDTFNERMQDLVLAAITSQLTDDRLLTIERDDCVDVSFAKTSADGAAVILNGAEYRPNGSVVVHAQLTPVTSRLSAR